MKILLFFFFSFFKEKIRICVFKSHNERASTLELTASSELVAHCTAVCDKIGILRRISNENYNLRLQIT